MEVTVSHFASDIFWGEDKNIDGFLAKKLKNGSSSLVLGAGASAGFKLPNWNDLVSKLRDVSGAPPRVANLTTAQESDRIFVNQYNGNRLAFAKAVRSALYQEANQDSKFLLKSELLQAISAFLTRSLKGNSGALVNFNFDDLVENYLRMLGFVVRSETSSPSWNTSADMVVYHPHGLLPQESEIGVTPIVFTTSDFSEVIGKSDDAWNQTMKSIWSTTFPLFLGLSGEDLRLLSLLGDIKKVHPATVSEKSKYWGVRITTKTEDPYITKIWQNAGVICRKVETHDDIPGWLLSICQQAAKIGV